MALVDPVVGEARHRIDPSYTYGCLLMTQLRTRRREAFREQLGPIALRCLSRSEVVLLQDALAPVCHYQGHHTADASDDRQRDLKNVRLVL